MKPTKTPLFFFFSILLIFSLSFAVPVLAVADSYGNQITQFDIYNKVAGVYDYPDSTTAAEYSGPDMAGSIDSDTLRFTAITALNNTLATYYESVTTQAVGLQILGSTTSYAGPMYSTPPYDQDADFWYLLHQSEWDLSISDNSVIVNATLWLDEQQNGTWAMTEEWTFNLTMPTSSEYVPDTVNGIDLSFIWFWATFGGAVITAVSGGLAVRKTSVPYFFVALFAGMFTFSFYMILSAGGG